MRVLDQHREDEMSICGFNRRRAVEFADLLRLPTSGPAAITVFYRYIAQAHTHFATGTLNKSFPFLRNQAGWPDISRQNTLF
jgi:hypothetical protein